MTGSAPQNPSRPIDALRPEEARGLSGLVFDLDDTLLDHGELTEVAYASLFRLREAGLRLVACTGRPAGWAEVLVRQWPIDAAVAENGAVAFVKERRPPGAPRSSCVFPADLAAAGARRVELRALAEELCRRFPTVALADDNAARFTDVTLDIGEHCRAQAEDVAAMRAEASRRGVHTLASSVHLHLSYDPADKATGTLRLLESAFGQDPVRARLAHAFVGDSGNDAAAFVAFTTTIGVANVRAYLPTLPVPPKYVTHAAMGRGFAELATTLAALRVPPG
ncbi:HAD-IIB family hydrolase [Polyangium spumosum]|uniref:HAD-IIB family hydrolase n=1 Tax=Polyangium spumosum TaxID=889282 RepID=A0A6N7Q300_9BACT|nr:HAD-IIB family hydrolase [Polyangium spumosum]